MTEQRGPRDLVADAVAAERAGYDFEVMSDHYFPWLDEMGHAPYAWSVLGAVATATERVGLMISVTCPIMRYHPAVAIRTGGFSADELSDSGAQEIFDSVRDPHEAIDHTLLSGRRFAPSNGSIAHGIGATLITGSPAQGFSQRVKTG